MSADAAAAVRASQPVAQPTAEPPVVSTFVPPVAPRWPDLFIVGAAYAGSAPLGRYLAQQPGIFMAPVHEPHFFSAIRPGPRPALFHPVISDGQTYLALFAKARPEQLWAEASSSYLWSADAALRIHAVAPDARVVVMLRDPVDRAWAHYWNAVLEGFERRSFLRAVRDEMARPGTWGIDAVYLGAGFYADAVARYLDLFGKEQVKVLFYETFRAHPRGSLGDVIDWLGMDARSTDLLVLEPRDELRRPRWRVVRRALGVSRLRRAALRVPDDVAAPLRRVLFSDADDPGMDETVEALLRDLYAADVGRLSGMLGIIPPWQ